MTGLQISADLALPLELVTEPIGILANRGRGKSYTTHVLVEEIHGAGVPVVVLDVKGDWWGLRSSADGKRDGLPFYIFGGDHADVPLEPTAGELLADLVVDQRVSVVLDLSHMSKTKARSFTVAFAERLSPPRAATCSATSTRSPRAPSSSTTGWPTSARPRRPSSSRAPQGLARPPRLPHPRRRRPVLPDVVRLQERTRPTADPAVGPRRPDGDLRRRRARRGLPLMTDIGTTRAQYVPAKINQRLEQLDQDLELARLHWARGVTDARRTAVLCWAALVDAAHEIQRLEAMGAAA